MDDLAFLRGIEAFRTLSRSDAKRLLAGTTRETFAPRTRILRRGDPGDAMYVVVEGGVEIPVPGPDGRTRFVAYLRPGDLFGEMALLTGAPRSADVLVAGETPCTCLVMRKEAVHELLDAHPPAAAFLTEILGRRLLEDQALSRFGKYRVVGEIARGAMATVFEGWHPHLARGVAIKMLSHGMVHRSDFAERFRNEAKVLAALRHPGIVEVYDLDEAFGTYFIVMERLQGTDLERLASSAGPLPADDVRRTLVDVARALEHAHAKGVIHRDVKPSNVFRLPDGTHRLVDFGIATGPVKASEEEEILCSPAYVAPEVVEGRRVDGRSDLYSLGILAFRLLAGRPPFPGTDYQALFDAHVGTPFPDVSQAVPGIPEDLRTFVERATQKRPTDRFAGAAEVVAHLAPGVASRTMRLEVDYDAPAAERVLSVVEEARRTLADLTGVRVRRAEYGGGAKTTG
jgi:CRP-like cAMP-binding protein/tRNA A-37 threonylcarbamoyl transferase component Bud32